MHAVLVCVLPAGRLGNRPQCTTAMKAEPPTHQQLPSVPAFAFVWHQLWLEQLCLGVPVCVALCQEADQDFKMPEVQAGTIVLQQPCCQGCFEGCKSSAMRSPRPHCPKANSLRSLATTKKPRCYTSCFSSCPAGPALFRSAADSFKCLRDNSCPLAK